MDFWEFLARSEWPAVVVGGLYMFRDPIKRKLDSTVKASGLGVSLEFGAAIAKAEALIQDRATATPIEDKATPEMIILDAWRQLMDKLTKSKGEPASTWMWEPNKFRDVAGRLGRGDDDIAALRELRAARDKVAHTVDATITQDEAKRFRQLTQRLAERLGETKPPNAT